MRPRSAHDGEAHGLVACADARAVRLRLSSVDVALEVLRFVFTVAGAAVVMWIGAAFLATPASAAVVTPLSSVTQQGGQKGGKEKPAGTDGKKSGAPKNNTSTEKKTTTPAKKETPSAGPVKKESTTAAPVNKNVPKTETGSTTPAGKNAATTAPIENGATKKGATTKVATENGTTQNNDQTQQPAPAKKEPAKPAPEKPAKKAEPKKVGPKKQPAENRSNENGAAASAGDDRPAVGAAKAAATSKPQAPEPPAKNDAKPVQKPVPPVATDRARAAITATDAKAAGIKQSIARTKDEVRKAAARKAPQQEAVRPEVARPTPLAGAEKLTGGVDVAASAKQVARDAVKRAVGEADKVVHAAVKRAEIAQPRSATKRVGLEQLVPELVQRAGTEVRPDALRALHLPGPAAAALRDAAAVGQAWQEYGDRVGQRGAAIGKAGKRGEDIAGPVAELVAEVGQVPGKPGAKGGELRCLAIGCETGALGKARPAPEADPTRAGNGRDTTSRGPPRDGSLIAPAQQAGGKATTSKSARATEKLLDDRIAVDNGAKSLEAEKAQVAAGTVTPETHAKHEAEQKQRTEQYEKDKAKAAPARAKLVDDVVDGHTQLTKSEAALAEEKKQVEAGTVSAETHQANVAKHEEAKSTVYAATDELRAATGSSTTAPRQRAPQDGAAAGCGKSGVFVECGATSTSDSGTKTDRCVALAGVSTGCGATASSGDAKGSASCTLTGAEQGCKSDTSKGDVTSSSSCTLAGKDCGNTTRADADGAAMDCVSDAGGCKGATNGPVAPAGEKTATAASCTGACAVGGLSDRAGADANCRTADGVCDASSTGSGTDRQAVSARAPVGDDQRGAGSSNGHCQAKSGGCDLTASVALGQGRSVQADAQARCGAGATECSGTAATKSDAVNKAETAARTTDGAADCAVTSGGCRAHSGSDTGRSDTAIQVECGTQVGCTGKGATATKAKATGVDSSRDGSGAASCEVSSGGCNAASSTVADNDDDGGARSVTSANVDCGSVVDCSGKAATATTGKVTAAAAVRETKADAHCDATAGGCSSSSTSEVGDNARAAVAATYNKDGSVKTAAVPAGRELTASSTAGANVACGDIDPCKGAGAATTSGGASGDITGVRDSTATSMCTAHGAGSGCDAGTTTKVADRAVTGPVSVSEATASVRCTSGTTDCGGTTSTATSARDTAVSPEARGTSSTSECAVKGGGCQGESSSKASSAPDFVAIDPATGKPVAGQPTSGPSSTASSSASVDCQAGAECSGSVKTTTSAFDGGAPRTSEGTATCSGGTGGCQIQSVSNATTGPGAALALAGEGQKTNEARLPAGPSAASAAGAALTCEGQTRCDGKVTSSATATDPAVSSDPRGSRSEGTCEGVTGGVCQAVTNSGASSGPDANIITPLVQARSTKNATVTQEQTGDAPAEQPVRNGEQPATPPAPAAPGSSANNGGPTVPGASSWTMANATLDCAGGDTGCTGTARSSAAGSDGPASGNGANGARGPPEGASTSSGSCSGTGACQVRTSSTAGAGQVVADIVAEQQNDTAEQLAEQADTAERNAQQAANVAAGLSATDEQKKTADDAALVAKQAKDAAAQAAELAAKPVTGAPATMSRSQADAMCAAAGCTATTTAGGSTSGLPAASHSAGQCTGGAGGCLVRSGSTATTHTSNETQATSSIACPDAACTGTLTGTATAPSSATTSGTSTATSGCRGGEDGCLADVMVGTSVTAALPAGQSYAAADCAAGSAACPTVTTSTATAPGNSAVATCANDGACEVDSGAAVIDGLPQVNAGCSGAVTCRAHSRGAATSGTNTAHFDAACVGGPGGRCDTGGLAAADADSAIASATCAGAQCTSEYAARSAVSKARAGGSASGEAACSGTGAAGWCGTSAAAEVGGGAAVAQASCAGSEQAQCSYRAEAHAAAGSRGNAGRGDAAGHGVGAGGVQVSAMAAAGRGSAMGGASCIGTAGTTCQHSYSARSSASAGGGAARASASGSAGGGMGSGAVMTSASASAGKGGASASASCYGAANCRHSYSASASAAASYSGPGKDGGTVHHWARASASGSGGGGQGGGGVSASASASANQSGASASASCSGAANCRASYESHSVADAWHDPHHYAHADADCVGGGNGGGCATSAVAKADDKSASAGASCGGSGSCRFSYSAHSSADLKTAREHVTGKSDCGDSGGSGGGGCGTLAYAEVDPSTGNALVHVACEGPGCSYSATGDALDENLIADAKAHQQCGAVGAGGCDIAVRAKLSTDRFREDMNADAFGACVGTAGSNCQGSYSTNVKDGSTTNGECKGVGSGGCHSDIDGSSDAKPVTSYGICVKDLPCDWTAKTRSTVKTDFGKDEKGEVGVTCSTSSAIGDPCVTSANVRLIDEKNKIKVDGKDGYEITEGVEAFVSCSPGTKVSCDYFSTADAKADSHKNSSETNQKCTGNKPGFCHVISIATAAGDDYDHNGVARAEGFCEGSEGTTCSGGFRTHVDSNRNTLSDCTGRGSGVCIGVAKPEGAYSTGVGDLHIVSVSPDARKEWRGVTGKDPVKVEATTADTTYRGVVNFVRGAWEGVEQAPSAVVNFVGDVGTHFGNWGRMAFGGEEFPHLAGESEEEYNRRVFPLKATWDESMTVLDDTVHGRNGRDWTWEPFGTGMKLISGPLLITPVLGVGGGVGAGIAKAAAGASARMTAAGVARAAVEGVAVTGGRMSVGGMLKSAAVTVGRGAAKVGLGVAKVGGTVLQVATTVVNKVGIVPLKPYFWGAKAVGYGAGKGLGALGAKLTSAGATKAGALLGKSSAASLALSRGAGPVATYKAFRDPAAYAKGVEEAAAARAANKAATARQNRAESPKAAAQNKAQLEAENRAGKQWEENNKQRGGSGKAPSSTVTFRNEGGAWKPAKTGKPNPVSEYLGKLDRAIMGKDKVPAPKNPTPSEPNGMHTAKRGGEIRQFIGAVVLAVVTTLSPVGGAASHAKSAAIERPAPPAPGAKFTVELPNPQGKGKAADGETGPRTDSAPKNTPKSESGTEPTKPDRGKSADGSTGAAPARSTFSSAAAAGSASWDELSAAEKHVASVTAAAALAATGVTTYPAVPFDAPAGPFQLRITPALERELRDGSLGGLRMVPVTRGGIARATAPRPWGVSARTWAKASAFERAQAWQDLSDIHVAAGRPDAAAMYREAARVYTEAALNRSLWQPGVNRPHQAAVDQLMERVEAGEIRPIDLATLIEAGWQDTVARSTWVVDRFVDDLELDWSGDDVAWVVATLRAGAQAGVPLPDSSRTVRDIVLDLRTTNGAEFDSATNRYLAQLADESGLAFDQMPVVVTVLEGMHDSGGMWRIGLPDKPWDAMRAVSALRERADELRRQWRLAVAKLGALEWRANVRQNNDPRRRQQVSWQRDHNAAKIRAGGLFDELRHTERMIAWYERIPLTLQGIAIVFSAPLTMPRPGPAPERRQPSGVAAGTAGGGTGPPGSGNAGAAATSGAPGSTITTGGDPTRPVAGNKFRHLPGFTSSGIPPPGVGRTHYTARTSASFGTVLLPTDSIPGTSHSALGSVLDALSSFPALAGMAAAAVVLTTALVVREPTRPVLRVVGLIGAALLLPILGADTAAAAEQFPGAAPMPSGSSWWWALGAGAGALVASVVAIVRHAVMRGRPVDRWAGWTGFPLDGTWPPTPEPGSAPTDRTSPDMVQVVPRELIERIDAEANELSPDVAQVVSRELIERLDAVAPSAQVGSADVTTDATQQLDPRATQPVDPDRTQPVSGELTQPVGADFTQPVAADVTKPVVVDETQPVSPELTQPVGGDATHQVTVDVTQPLGADATQPVNADVTQPVAADVTLPVGVDATQPVSPELTQPLRPGAPQPAGAEVTQPVAADVTQPLGADAAQPVNADVTQPVAAGVTRPVAVDVTQPVSPELTQPLGPDAPEPASADATQPVGGDATQPVGVDETQPVSPELTQRVGAEVTQPAPADVTQPMAADATQPIAADATQPVAADATQPVTVDVTQPVDVDKTQPVSPELTQPVPAAPTAPVTLLAVLWVLLRAPSGVTPADIREMLGTTEPVAVVEAVLAELAAAGLAQPVTGGRFHLGARAAALLAAVPAEVRAALTDAGSIVGRPALARLNTRSLAGRPGALEAAGAELEALLRLGVPARGGLRARFRQLAVLVGHLWRIGTAVAEQRAQRGAARTTRALVARELTAEHRGWMRWLAERAPPGVDAVSEIARALGITERAARAALRRATPVRPPGAAGSFGAVLRSVAARIEEAVPADVKDVAVVDAAAGKGAAAVADGLRDGLAAVRVVGLRAGWAESMLRRAAVGRGVVARAARLANALRLDRAGLPRSTAAAALALAGIGAAFGALATLPSTVTGILLASALGALLVRPALRGLRWLVKARAPPLARLVRVAAALFGLGVGVAAGVDPGLLRDIGGLVADAARWLSGQVLTSMVVRFAVSAALAYRYVLRRQTLNRSRGMERNPRRDALVSALAVGLVSGAFDLMKLLAVGGWAVALTSLVAVGLVAGVANVLQRKDVGRKRAMNALLAAIWVIPVNLLGGIVGVGVVTGSVGDWLLGLLATVLVVAPVPFVSDYLAAKYGAVGARRALAKWTALRQRHAATSEDQRAMRRVARRMLDLLSINPFDPRLSLLKLDSVLGAGLVYAVLRPWPGDTPLTVAARLAIAGLFLVVVNRWRDAYERAKGYLGYASPRPIRRVARPGTALDRLRTGGRLLQGTLALRAAFGELLGDRAALVGIEARTAQQREMLARWIAGVLAERLTDEVTEALETWMERPTAENVMAARERMRAAAIRRQHQHVDAVVHVIALLGALAAAGMLDRGAATLHAAGRADAAALLGFAGQVLARLRSHDKITSRLPEAGRDADWAGRLAARIKERNDLRARFLDHRRELLLELRTVYPDGSAERNLVEEELEQTYVDEAKADLRKGDVDPLNGAAQLLEERAGSLTGPTRPRADKPGDLQGRADAVRVVLDLVLALSEVRLARGTQRTARAEWHAHLRAATAGAPTLAPTSPLGVLLAVAGRTEAVTATQLAAAHGGGIGIWQGRLAVLAAAGAVTGSPEEGHLLRADLAARWAAADAPLRHALRTNPLRLPGTAELIPLTQLSGADADLVRAGVSALSELLRSVTATFRHPYDGIGYELAAARAHLAGLRYQARHPLGRPAMSAATARPRALKAAESKKLAAMLRHHRSHVRVANRLAERALVAFVGSVRVPGLGPRAPPPAVVDAMLAARLAQTHAYIALFEARQLAEQAARAAGAYQHQVDALVAIADRVLADRPGGDPSRPTVLSELARVRAQLERARADLRASPNRHTLRAALVALDLHDAVDAAAWEVGHWRTAGGWIRLSRARAAARALRGDLGQVRVAPAPRVASEHIPDGPDGGYRAAPGNPVGAAARTVRGRRHQVDQDAAAVGRTADGIGRYAAGADGLSAGAGSELAAAAAVTAAGAVLRRHRPGADPEVTVRRAFAAAMAAVAALPFEPGHHPPTTTLAIVLVTPVPGVPGRFVRTVAAVGDTRVYWVERGATAATLLTTDHVRSGALTSWLGVDRRPTVAVSRTEVGPGTALVLTDGLWSTIADPATSLTRDGDAQRAVHDLFVAAGEASRVDDQTAAVITVRAGTVPPARGGPLAVGDLTRAVAAAVLALLPRLANRMRPVRSGEFPALLPRGPPVATSLLVLDVDPAVGSALEQAGVVDPAGRLIAFGWKHPGHAPHGAIVMFRETLAELDALVAAGHLDEGWFTALVDYELRFRIRRSPLPQERRRVAAATALLDRLAEARRAASGGVSAGPVRSRPWVAAAEQALARLRAAGAVPIDAATRESWAARLDAVPAEGEPLVRVLARWAADTARVLRSAEPAVVFHTGGAAGRPLHLRVGGVEHVVAASPVEAVAALVAGRFGREAGLSAAQVDVVAMLVPPVLAVAAPMAATGDVRNRLAELFADRQLWRELALLHGGRVAVAAGPVAEPAGRGRRRGWFRRGTPDQDGPATGDNPLAGLFRPRPNLLPATYADEVRFAERHGVRRVPLDDAAGVAAIVATQPVVKGVVDIEGRVWIIPAGLPPAPGTRPADVLTFSHAVAAQGRDVQLAFMAALRVQDGRIIAEVVTPESGHYNDGNSPQQNRRIAHAVSVAFEAHGVPVRSVAGFTPAGTSAPGAPRAAPSRRR